MPIGSSGPIKLSEIRDTYGLTGSNISLAGGTTPTAGSCFGKAAAYGVNQTQNPGHAFSEFRNASAALACGTAWSQNYQANTSSYTYYYNKYTVSSSGNSTLSYSVTTSAANDCWISINIVETNATGTGGTRGMMVNQKYVYLSGNGTFTGTIGPFAVPNRGTSYKIEVSVRFGTIAATSGSFSVTLNCPTGGEACGSQKSLTVSDVCPGSMTDYQFVEGTYVDVGTTSGQIDIPWTYNMQYAKTFARSFYLRLYYGSALVVNQQYTIPGDNVTTSISNTLSYAYNYNGTDTNLLLTVYDLNSCG